MKGMQVIVTLALFLSACVALSTNGCHVVNATVAAGYCARVHYSGFSKPRGIKVLDNNEIIILDVAAGGVTGSIKLIYDSIEGNTTTRSSVVLATHPGLNHGITFDESLKLKIYASNVTYVFRWPYTLGSRSPLVSQEIVISNMPTYLSHDTRTLLYDATRAAIIVSVGSEGNIDDSGVPGLYRFSIANFPSTFSNGTVIATGLRNEVGIKFDTTGRLWGVENGVDNLARSDLGGDIHNEHPGEELNLFERDGGFYGYPFCWSMYRNFTQYAWPTYLNAGTTTDAWCQNTSNVVLPQYVLRAHTAPLDITFYAGSQFPGATGDAFISQHGSWNRIPAAGYAIVQVNMENGVPTADEKIFSYSGPGEFPPLGSPQWYRPVSMDWAKCEGLDCLLFTSDSTGDILSLKYSTTCDCDIEIPTTTTTTATATTTTSSASILSVSVLLASVVLAVSL